MVVFLYSDIVHAIPWGISVIENMNSADSETATGEPATKGVATAEESQAEVPAEIPTTDDLRPTNGTLRQTVSLIGTVFREVLQVVVPAILLALAIHIFLAQATVVYGQSMQPNLQPSERLVIEKLSYYFGAPQRNDIVVLDRPQVAELLIKRVVGLPGESVEIRRGTVLIDGQSIEQSFVQLPDGSTYGPITLGADDYFVMGDNRNNSNDSRAFGPVHRGEIMGKAWLRYWPLNRFTILK
ncbi:MAG: signal peptidase I [Chloroflexi bacterium]|nr:MAG: signal peptidase I [Chloroflexota bacterium]